MSKKLNIKPLADRVLIEAMTWEEKTKSGIIVPETVDREKSEQGKVLAVGVGKQDKDGKLIKLSVKKGDLVLFSKYGPSEIKVDGKDYLIAREDDILAILE